MSDPFASQLSQFRKTVRNSSTTLPSQRRIVDKSSLKRSNDALNDDETKRPRTSDYDSAPASSLSIRLMTASDFIKTSDHPVKIDELQQHIKCKVDPKLLKVLTNVDRIKYDPVNQTLEYLSLHNIKTGDDLIKVLENQPTFSGLSVKQLKDGWNGCLETLAQLEKEEKIIVHKTKKENAPRHIWLNVGFYKLENVVEPEFYDMWAKIKVPKGDDLVRQLIETGSKPTNVDPDSVKSKKVAPVQERKQKKARRGKITNTHMKGILKDYSKMS
ncbi:hypothetical protein KL930_000300 [Ogataea haglerorum]|nr:hypothetical protein KL923_001038 [Ogataea haglerorum]KAG7742381.1 hypothetical protein KL932_002523 [Ogataea haglerorum]KAG7777679.1 hypothetical protein KL922_002497 [Ogataea haglerorum]KAG7782966.1 hypothetical protein KL930_000300 [Ogataea haglerorum]KAG7807886.1 hypothetical protein KL924_003569 [Ogataea haglerorum]